MPKVTEKRIKSFVEFITLVEELQSRSPQPLWFRGVGNSSHSLLPSLFRHPTKKIIGELCSLEQSLIARFKQRSIPFHSRSLDGEWDNIFFMQHFGIPTRLLDWSENPLIALYFATMSARSTITANGKLSFDADAAIWVLDPVAWNRKSLEHQSFDGGILTPGDEALKGYRPSSPVTGMFNHPVALYGAHNSPRIVAQRGVFTIFGQNVDPMETVFDKQKFPKGCLTKFILGKTYLPAIRKSVLTNGTTESVVFPDLEGLGREIKRNFGFTS